MVTEVAVKERPILFSSAMVRAILEVRKTQTRRVIKGVEICGPNRPNASVFDVLRDGKWLGAFGLDGTGNATKLCPYGVPGDRLWVRETLWQRMAWTWVSIEDKDWIADGHYEYVATQADMPDTQEHKFHWRKIPAIHMPRRASRITLEVTKVRVERVQEISNGDAKAEGVQFAGEQYRETFRELWDSINGKKHPWTSNPWVWVIEFRPVARGEE